MFNFDRFKSGTATLLALTITSSTVVPIITTASALAQGSPPRREEINIVIPSGTSIPVRYDKEKIIVMPDETAAVTLTVATNVTASDGSLVIPEGSQISGELKPVSGGTQFVAKELTFYRRQLEKQSRAFRINATSNVVTRTEEISKGSSTTSILTGAALGGGAAAAIAALTGNRSINTLEVLGGVGLGALGGVFLNRKKVDAIVIYPNQDLTVTLMSEFDLRLPAAGT
jgi:hypothetical protein